MRRVLVGSRGNQGDCAGMFNIARIGVNPIMQLWRNTEGDGPQKGRRNERSHNTDAVNRTRAGIHLRRELLSSARSAQAVFARSMQFAAAPVGRDRARRSRRGEGETQPPGTLANEIAVGAKRIKLDTC